MQKLWLWNAYLFDLIEVPVVELSDQVLSPNQEKDLPQDTQYV